MSCKITWTDLNNTTISTALAKWPTASCCSVMAFGSPAVRPAREFDVASRGRQHGVIVRVHLADVWCPALGTNSHQKAHHLPRTGYVAYRQGGKSFWTIILASFVISIAITVGVAWLSRFYRRHDGMNLLWMGAVAVTAAGYGYFIYRWEKDHPWKWLVLLFMALGLLAIALIAPADFVGLWRPCFCSLVLCGSAPARPLCVCTSVTHNHPPRNQNERPTSSHFRIGPGHS